jgi:hypothetical protein
MAKYLSPNDWPSNTKAASITVIAARLAGTTNKGKTMQPFRPIQPLALGLCLVVPIVAALADQTGTFDGHYRGSMTLAPSGRSEAYGSPACADARPAVMSVRNGFVFMSYRDWGRHRIHHRGRVNPDGTVNAYHHNGDGSSSAMIGNFTGAQFSADLPRGLCDYTVMLTRG